MSPACPPREVIDTAAGTGGLVHVGVFLAQALSQATGPTLEARPDLHKCAGAGLPGCATCVRLAAPAGAGQQWCKPRIADGACANHASVERYRSLYTSAAKPLSEGA